MNEPVLNVLIADDEIFIREGLKYIIDWRALGFDICGEAQDGMDALEKMASLHPNLVLLDIQMPLLSGIELIQKARENGYEGEFIILSGFSDFQYAQAAIRYGVSCYLTKPIDETLLTQAVLSAKEKILSSLRTKDSYYRYMMKARNTVLADLLGNAKPDINIHYEEFGFTFPVYQIILYENLDTLSRFHFAEVFAAVCGPNDSFEQLTLEGRNLLLLKGNSSLTRFRTFLSRCQGRLQKDSPLDSVFLVCGRPVYSLKEFHPSYLECCLLMERRFFCQPSQHAVSPKDLPAHLHENAFADSEHAQRYARKLSDYIKSANRKMIAETLDELESRLLSCPDKTAALKHFLADILLQVRSCVTQSYSQVKEFLCSNAALLEQVEQRSTLNEIMSYYMEQFEIMINAVGGNSDTDSVFENILDYINHNYGEALKLEALAPLFGYNSSYLGKLFTQRMGKNFNSYLNEIRVQNAARMLLETNRAAGAIAALSGYRSVDYFYQKFKQEFGCSPAEYRKKQGQDRGLPPVL